MNITHETNQLEKYEDEIFNLEKDTPKAYLSFEIKIFQRFVDWINGVWR